MFLRHFHALLVVAALLGATDTRAESEPAGKAEAERLFAQGAKAAKANHWAEARDHFRDALEIVEHPQILAQLGRAEFELGENRNAAEHLTRFLGTATDVSDEDRHLAEAMLARAKSRVGILRVTVTVPGAELLVDGKSIGIAPSWEPVFVDVGHREIEARRVGRASAHRTLEVEPGKTYEVELSLEQTPSVAPASRSRLFLGGIAAGTVLAGAGTALAIFSGMKGTESKQAWVDADAAGNAPDSCKQGTGPFCRHVIGLEEQQRRLAIASIGTFVAAGAIAGATGLYYGLGRRRADSGGSVAFVPFWEATSAGLVVSGTW
ncbi:PEGA domain-containing protein [Polyangium jinanense]|uniref:PEGA domain-containing protein n=1 Tax=Polyangium jinanense TaxID=2829994 RepID=UPI00234037AB|nr:PEGA domain-containing protein [Polyangium jinanense]MDC3956934.1 PEGA domain-containing protein [Polyangium jinanense]